MLTKGETYMQKVISLDELEQRRSEYQAQITTGKSTYDTHHFTPAVKSSGFAIETHQDNTIQESDGNQRKIKCGTEKGNHKAKNHRTAGILAIAKPCSIVVDIKELFGSESKSQVYAHLHELIQKPAMETIDTICYDDACHLKKFALNPKRSDLTATSKKMSQMHMVCDKFHFKNHVDAWCKKHCNPYTCANLKNINTEVCEQLFSWLSKYASMTKHMNRWRFLFLMLYLVDNHNEEINKGANW